MNQKLNSHVNAKKFRHGHEFRVHTLWNSVVGDSEHAQLQRHARERAPGGVACGGGDEVDVRKIRQAWTGCGCPPPQARAMRRDEAADPGGGGRG